MLRLDLQFYAFFMTIICGAVLGLLFDLLRAMRGYYRPGRWTGSFADLFFWVVTTAALAIGLFSANWAEVRLYVLVGILVGGGGYYWLASPVVISLARAVFGLIEWVCNLLVTLFFRLVWWPLVAVAGFLWAVIRLVWRWGGALLAGCWRVLSWLAGPLIAPLIGPYRFVRLHYLLLKRRLRRWFRA